MIDTSFLKGRTVAVMGLGKSGTATAKALAEGGARVWAWDDDEAARHTAATTGVPIVDLAAADFSKLSLLVWSPGIPHRYPRPHPLANKARAAGVEPVCDVELLARALPRARLLGISGTNGKSTTTTLLAHVEAAAGRPVAAGGNLGTPALALPEPGPGGRIVLELSSYQLELAPSLALDAAALLNITPDHLGRHGGLAGYIAAKRRLFDHLKPGGTAVIGTDDPSSAAIAAELTAAGRRVVAISAERRLDRGVSAADGVLRIDGTAVADLTALARLPGRHNWQNACAVAAMAIADGIDAATIATALTSYPGLAHRQELVGVVDGVAYINDSKATNADAVEKALVCYDRILWILGGQAKEGGIASLTPHFPRIVHAFLIGEAAATFAETLAGQVAFSRCGRLDAAVAAAHAMARPGDTVLLSPACASWDQFTSFEHRGEVFRSLVAALAEGGAP
jgi:UDP-N-acetylmuramoylalanine--D-glutamate ligase